MPLEVEGYELEGQEFEASPEFTRVSTTIRIKGGGEEGIGEDVTYEALDHIALQDAGPVQPLAGSHTIGSFCELVGGLDLFPAEPVREVSRLYRRWAFESAALDLALRQQGIPLTEALGREAQPVTFVASLRLGEPPTIEPVANRLARYPTLRFKLDPTSSWTDELIAELVATGAIDSVDFKGQYKGTVVDQPPDPELYAKVVEAFPDAWIEDPALTDETEPILEPAPRPDHLGRADPLDRRHRGAALPAEDGEREAVTRRRPARRCSTPTTGARSAASPPTAAGSGSSAAGAARSSTWPRSSTRTRPTTSRRRATTTRACRKACRRARSALRRRRLASAGRRKRVRRDDRDRAMDGVAGSSQPRAAFLTKSSSPMNRDIPAVSRTKTLGIAALLIARCSSCCRRPQAPRR